MEPGHDVRRVGPGIDQADHDALRVVAVDPDPNTGQPERFRLHPGVAESGRTAAGPEVMAVDTQLAAYWLTLLQRALDRENEEMGWLHAARAATPYLLRQQQWEQALLARAGRTYALAITTAPPAEAETRLHNSPSSSSSSSK